MIKFVITVLQKKKGFAISMQPEKENPTVAEIGLARILDGYIEKALNDIARDTGKAFVFSGKDGDLDKVIEKHLRDLD